MDRVFHALRGAVQSMVHPTIFAVMVVPMGIALILWIFVGWLAWETWNQALQTYATAWIPASWTARWDLAWLGLVLALTAVVFALAPLVIATSLLFAALFAMPALLKHVARRSFPDLERKRGGTFAGSIWNAVAAVCTFLLLWVLTIPLWLLGPLALMLPLLLSANLNQRLFRYDALSEHASAEEMREVFEQARGRLFLLGLTTGVLYFIPPINLVAPVFSALAFIHLCLAELQSLRAGSAQG